jgi:hypothetical protein
MKTKVYIAMIVAVVVLGGTAACFYVRYKNEVYKNTDLTRQLNTLYDKEKKSVIMRSVSTQMEEIAY